MIGKTQNTFNGKKLLLGSGLFFAILTSGCATTTPTFLHHITDKGSFKKTEVGRSEFGLDVFFQPPIGLAVEDKYSKYEADVPINLFSASGASSGCYGSICLDLFATGGFMHLSIGAGFTWIGQITSDIVSSLTPFVALPILTGEAEYKKDMNDYNGIGLYGIKWNWKLGPVISHFGFERSRSYNYDWSMYEESSSRGSYYHTYSIGMGGTFGFRQRKQHFLFTLQFVPENQKIGLAFTMGMGMLLNE